MTESDDVTSLAACGEERVSRVGVEATTRHVQGHLILPHRIRRRRTSQSQRTQRTSDTIRHIMLWRRRTTPRAAAADLVDTLATLCPSGGIGKRTTDRADPE